MDNGSPGTCLGGQCSTPMDTHSHTHTQWTKWVSSWPCVPTGEFSRRPPWISLDQTSHDSTPIFVKTQFFLLFIIFFCYKTCTGCLEQQQKYNIQFICNFFHSMIIDSSWVDPYWSSVFCLIVPKSKKVPEMVSDPFWALVVQRGWGVRRWVGRNKYRGQDVAEVEQEFSYSLTPDNSM